MSVESLVKIWLLCVFARRGPSNKFSQKIDPFSYPRSTFFSFFQKPKILFAVSQLLASQFSRFKVHTSCDRAMLSIHFGNFVFMMSHCDVRVVFTFIMQITHFYNFCHILASSQLIFSFQSAY